MKNVKKIIIALLFMLNLATSISAVYAADFAPGSAEDLFHKFQYNQANGPQNDLTSKLGAVQSLPGGSKEKIITGIIRIMLSLTGAICFAAFTYAGILMVTSQGNDDATAKAKKMILLCIVAMAIMAASYAIVSGVAQLKFFTTTP